MAMDFFEQQDLARRKTGWLILCFSLAVLTIILAVYLLFAAALGQLPAYRPGAESGWWALWNPSLLAWVSLGTIAVIAAGSLYKISQLSSGGEGVALMLGGRMIDPKTTDLAQRRLLNVVEELALASGIPVPPVYVLDEEPGINAFAAGHEPGDAVIGVSRGCLAYLTRDELQGVMGHEFSHILNGDMRLNLRLIGIINGILILAILGYYIIRAVGRSSPRSSKKGGGAAGFLLVGLGLLAIGYIGVFFGKLIKSGVSRQREYLADASAVQFTRYPSGIAGALKKIGGLAESSRINDAHAEEVSHMFFGDAFAGRALNFFATHPPLEERIRRLDPSFDGTFPAVKPLVEEQRPFAPGEEKPGRPEPAGVAVGAQRGDRRARTRLMPLDPAGVVGRMGIPAIEQILYAGALITEMPQTVLHAAHEPYAARAVVYALLLAKDQADRNKQLESLKQRIEELSYRETLQLEPLVDKLGDHARLPLVDLTFPALKKLSPAQYATFRDNVEFLVAADGKIDLFEYTIRTVLLRRLDVHFGRSKPASVRYAAISPVSKSVVTVLSTLAHAGQETQEDAERAFEIGMQQIGEKAPMLSKTACVLSDFDRALQELAQTAPKIKKRIATACAACIAADGRVTVAEGELLRVIAATLGCPLPPVTPPATANTIQAAGEPGRAEVPPESAAS